MESRIAYLRPAQIQSRLRDTGLVYLPVGPLEWHGPHLPYGVDPLNAERVARAACGETGGLVWPTLFWGTERERSPEGLRNLGLAEDQYVVGMDFPGFPLPSAYCPEELFAVVMRETLRQIGHLGARRVAIINGHGAVNHNQVLRRLEAEINHTSDMRLYVRIAVPQKDIAAGSIGHAAYDETSLTMHYAPASVDLSSLPPRGEPIRYRDTGVVDGPGFDGRGRPDKTTGTDDPRAATAGHGQAMFNATVNEIASEIRRWLSTDSRK